PASVARAAEAGGATAVSLINTLKAHAIHRGTGGRWLGGGGGGLSGAAIRQIALEQVRQVAAAVAIPAIGMGGVESGSDALALFDAGAAAVAVGTASFRDPLAAERVRSELAEESQRRSPEGADERLGSPESEPAPSTST